MPGTPDEEQGKALLVTVDSAIDIAMKKFDSGDFKITVAEFARLLDLRKELSNEAVSVVKVTWHIPFEDMEPVTEA
jgi:hypothetical protein